MTGCLIQVSKIVHVQFLLYVDRLLAVYLDTLHCIFLKSLLRISCCHRTNTECIILYVGLISTEHPSDSVACVVLMMCIIW